MWGSRQGSTDLFSLVTSDKRRREWCKVVSGNSDWILGKNFLRFLKFLKGDQTLQQVAQGSGRTSSLMVFKKHQDSALRQRFSFWSGPVWSQELGSMIHVRPFQLRMLYYSMILLQIQYFLCVCLLPNNNRYIYLFCLLSHFSFALPLASISCSFYTLFVFFTQDFIFLLTGLLLYFIKI